MRPTPEEVRRIAAVPDPVIRNLQITECYSRLAAAVAERRVAGANWCTFATWASRQAGRTIRGEDLLDRVGRELGRDAELLHPIAVVRGGGCCGAACFDRGTGSGRSCGALHTPFDAVELASDAVARGNLQGVRRDRARVRPVVARRRRGVPAGRRTLSCARRSRASRRRTPTPELIVLANLEIGLHEQTRLQPEIPEAMDAADGAEQEALSASSAGRSSASSRGSAARWSPQP